MNNTAEDILALTIDFYNKYILNKHVEGLSNAAHFDENGLKINSKFFKKYNLQYIRYLKIKKYGAMGITRWKICS